MCCIKKFIMLIYVQKKQEKRKKYQMTKMATTLGAVYIYRKFKFNKKNK